MRTRATTTTAATTLALAVLVGGCNSQGEPTDSTSTASGPSSSVDQAKAEEKKMNKAADEAYRDYWPEWTSSSGAEPPSKKGKALLTDEAYNNAIEDAKTAAPTKVEGRDKLLSTEVQSKWGSGGPTATVAVCYEAHAKYVLTEDAKSPDGKTVKKGTDIRTDPKGEPLKAGTEVGQIVTMKRDRDDGSQWKVHATEVGHDEACSSKGEKKDDDSKG